MGEHFLATPVWPKNSSIDLNVSDSLNGYQMKRIDSLITEKKGGSIAGQSDNQTVACLPLIRFKQSKLH